MCKCIGQINKELLALGKGEMRLAITIPFSGPCYPYIYAEYKKGRGSAKQTIIPAYCPFCGKAYPKKKAGR